MPTRRARRVASGWQGIFSMKKLISVFLCAGLAALAWAAPWNANEGVYQHVRTPRKPSTPAVSSTHRGTGLDPLLRIVEGMPIRVQLIVDERWEADRPAIEGLIIDSYRELIAAPAREIKVAGREEEFADIMPILTRVPAVRFVSEGEEKDIIFSIIPKDQWVKKGESDRTSCGHYIHPRVEGEYPHIQTSYTWEEGHSCRLLGTRLIFLHEIAHSLGLGDRYAYTVGGYTYEPTQGMYASPLDREPRRSLMKGNVDRVTCDDAEGIINLIDLARGTRRGEYAGWESLCYSGVYYSEAKRISTQEQLFMTYEADLLKNPVVQVESRQAGKGRQSWSFFLASKDKLSPFDSALQEDKNTWPVRHAPRANGSLPPYDIYYQTIEGYKRIRAVVADNELVLLEEMGPNGQYRVLFVEDGRPAQIYLDTRYWGGTRIHYTRVTPSGEIEEVLRGPEMRLAPGNLSEMKLIPLKEEGTQQGVKPSAPASASRDEIASGTGGYQEWTGTLMQCIKTGSLQEKVACEAKREQLNRFAQKIKSTY